jgi:cell division transport system permease protein
MEAIVTAAVSLLLAGGALTAAMYFGVEQRLRDSLGFIPWIDWPDFLSALVVVAILAPILTLLPTLLVTRKYLKV